jgi:hypothetical protein
MPEHITTIRPPREDEFQSWAPLFRAYRAFYDLAADEAVVERVWSWIHSPVHETNALIAVTNDGVTVGLAHYRRFARPSTGTMGIYFDDLLTDPAHRGTGHRPRPDRGRHRDRRTAGVQHPAMDHRRRQRPRPAALRHNRDQDDVAHL